jgi:hypothetical protein
MGRVLCHDSGSRRRPFPSFLSEGQPSRTHECDCTADGEIAGTPNETLCSILAPATQGAERLGVTIAVVKSLPTSKPALKRWLGRPAVIPGRMTLGDWSDSGATGLRSPLMGGCSRDSPSTETTPRRSSPSLRTGRCLASWGWIRCTTTECPPATTLPSHRPLRPQAPLGAPAGWRSLRFHRVSCALVKADLSAATFCVSPSLGTASDYAPAWSLGLPRRLKPGKPMDGWHVPVVGGEGHAGS